MARKYFQTFTVESTFSFPIDMLRYDSCFPHTERDSGEITDSITSFKGFSVEVGRYVKYKNIQPTIARWESFNCKVSKVETR